jgi:hypothetical protein
LNPCEGRLRQGIGRRQHRRKQYGAISSEALKMMLDETMSAHATVLDRMLKEAMLAINSALTHVESLR